MDSNVKSWIIQCLLEVRELFLSRIGEPGAAAEIEKRVKALTPFVAAVAETEDPEILAAGIMDLMESESARQCFFEELDAVINGRNLLESACKI